MRGKIQTIVIFTAIILFLGGLLFTRQPNDKSSSPRPSESPQVENCAVLNCHGLGIECGKGADSLVCTQEYAAGDRCRQHAKCEVVDGQCQPVLPQRFLDCKECVEKCNIYQADPEQFFQCENKC